VLITLVNLAQSAVLNFKMAAILAVQQLGSSENHMFGHNFTSRTYRQNVDVYTLVLRFQQSNVVICHHFHHLCNCQIITILAAITFLLGHVQASVDASVPIV
jgi:hypothetical protein